MWMTLKYKHQIFVIIVCALIELPAKYLAACQLYTPEHGKNNTTFGTKRYEPTLRRGRREAAAPAFAHRVDIQG